MKTTSEREASAGNMAWTAHLEATLAKQNVELQLTTCYYQHFHLQQRSKISEQHKKLLLNSYTYIVDSSFPVSLNFLKKWSSHMVRESTCQ